MASTLEELRAKNSAEVTLPSGLKVTGTLPRIRDCIIAGEIPLPVLTLIEQKASADEGSPDLTFEEMRAIAQFNDSIVLAFVTHVDGQAITLTHSDLALLEEDDINELVMYASRAKPLPGKE